MGSEPREGLHVTDLYSHSTSSLLITMHERPGGVGKQEENSHERQSAWASHNGAVDRREAGRQNRENWQLDGNNSTKMAELTTAEAMDLLVPSGYVVATTALGPT